MLAVSLGNVGGMIATRRSFGGTIMAQTSFGTLVVISSFSLFKAWGSIREGKVDRHRVWMLRAWSYIGSVSNRFDCANTGKRLDNEANANRSSR